MNIIFVVSNVRDWPTPLPGVEIVPARTYLMNTAYSESTDTKVFNLCKSTRYQSRGYYVSLLAEARGHHPVPDVKAIEDSRSKSLMQFLAASINDAVQSSFSHTDADHVELHIYFGRDAQQCYEHLSEQLFNLLRIPLISAHFERTGDRWHLNEVSALSIADVPLRDFPLLMQAARDCLQGHRLRVREPAAQMPTLAILCSSDGSYEPSNTAAIRKFQKAAEDLGILAEVITRQEADRLPQFDALFIRDTTCVNHYTYQLSRQAAAAGLVVIDDPDSILHCNNKLYLTELLSRHKLPILQTLIVHRENIAQIIPRLGLPCVLKQPDGAFSCGVVKVDSAEELTAKVMDLLETSELILAQEYLPTEFDWRIGVLDRRALFACKYHMVEGHWQIIKHQDKSYSEGVTEAVALDAVPLHVMRIALEAANLIGDGFYGVDIKERGDSCCIIEINDNPNVDAGNEDGVLKDALYQEVMSVFRKRIEARKGARTK
jgi:glutathione synthase/RimK-type ligase-like ATP-grasp enzyme